MANFVYIPKITTDLKNGSDDVKDELLSERVFISEQQAALLGEIPYLHRRRDGKEIVATLEGIVSTKATAASKMEMKNMERMIENKIKNNQVFLNKDIEEQVLKEKE